MLIHFVGNSLTAGSALLQLYPPECHTQSIITKSMKVSEELVVPLHHKIGAFDRLNQFDV